MRYLFLIVFLFYLNLSAEVVSYTDLPKNIQHRVVPDLDGKVLIEDNILDHKDVPSQTRELPQVATGWPVSYTNSNCHNGSIYLDMDNDAESEILFGVGTKIAALNLDGSAVPGWPVQLNFYIWSSPAAGDIDGDGEMEIVCTSRNNTNGNSGELYAFELDGTACAGFPVVQAGGGTNNVCLYDLDGDDDMEILVNVRNHPEGWLYVFDGDGTVYPNFPQALDYIPGAGISAGDINGDNIPEIVALSYNQLHVFDLDGNLLDGFPVENPGYTYSYSQPILFDLDGNGNNDVIWGGCNDDGGAVFAVHEFGASLPGWPVTTDHWIFGTVSIADVDQDGSFDVVVGDQVSSGTPANHIYAWDNFSNPLPGFPAGPTNAIYSQIGIADLDGDEQVELMIDDNAFGAGYNCYNHDGTQCADWPLPCGTIWSSTTMQITPTFGDVDADGEIEIMGAATDIVGWVVECYLWETGELWNEDLAYMIIDGCNIQHNGLYAETEAPPTFDPPQFLEADRENYNEVHLSWQSPNGDNIVKHHNGFDDNGIGGPHDFQCAARFDSVELQNYYDVGELEWINLTLLSDTFDNAYVKVFEGGSYGDPGTEIYCEEITNSVIPGEMLHHHIADPIPLVNGNEYWLGYEFVYAADHPAAVDAGPMVPGKGAWIYAGVNWELLTDIAPIFDYNWIIEGVITIPSDNSRYLMGYNVHRDGEEIAQINDPAILEYHDDQGLDAGIYEYFVTALYEDPTGESEPSNIAEVEITLPPPINLSASSAGTNVLLQWDYPERGLESFNVYRDEELIAEGITSIFYIDQNVPFGNHIWNVTAVYTGEYESIFSNDAGNPSDANEYEVPIVTELIGNYPNPFNPETTISYSLTDKNAKDAKIEIFNLKGQKVNELEIRNDEIRIGSVTWNGTDENGKPVPSGVYLYRLQAGDYEKTKKMLLLK